MGATSMGDELGDDRRGRRRTAAVILVAVGSLLVAACGGGDDDGDDADTTVDSAATADSSATDDPAVTESAAETSAASTSSTSAETESGELEYVTDGAVVLVANASRVDGGAGSLTDALGAVGYTTTDPTNSSADVDKLETSQIFYVTGDAAAQAVADNLRLVFGGGDITVEEVADPAPTESGGLGDGTVLVLMGNDIAGQTLEELGAPAAAADDAAESDDATTDADDAPTTEADEPASTDADDGATTEPPATEG